MNEKFKSAFEKIRKANVEVADDDNSLFKASLDHTRFSVKPAFVVYAKSVEDVQNVLRVANEELVGVSVRGAGSGCAGGCVPIDEGIVLDLSKLNKIEIDSVSRIATVGAGAITADIDSCANKFGLFYAPDPSSHKYSTIGGNIACNAGGLRALKYGVTRDNVISLTAVTATGEIVNCARPLKKFSVGLNLRDLFVGSEGLLGVVVEAKLKLLPLPEAKRAVAIFFKDDFSAFEGVGKIMQAQMSPCVLEFMDCETVACVREKAPELNIPQGSAVLLAEFDGTEEEVCKSAEKCARLFDCAKVSKSAEESQKLWNIRRYASSAMYLLADTKISQDIVLPLDSLKQFFKFFKDLGSSFGLATPVFGHSGDGNYHIHFMFNADDVKAQQNARKAMDLSIEKVIELGGAVSGEHGIGFAKAKYMSLQHSEFELDLMRKIKKVFDPNNILNNSKVVYVSGVYNRLSPLKDVKLPWD